MLAGHRLIPDVGLNHVVAVIQLVGAVNQWGLISPRRIVKLYTCIFHRFAVSPVLRDVLTACTSQAHGCVLRSMHGFCVFIQSDRLWCVCVNELLNHLVNSFTEDYGTSGT